MARWAAGAKWAAGPAPGDQRDTPLVLSLSEGLGRSTHICEREPHVNLRLVAAGCEDCKWLGAEDLEACSSVEINCRLVSLSGRER